MRCRTKLADRKAGNCGLATNGRNQAFYPTLDDRSISQQKGSGHHERVALDGDRNRHEARALARPIEAETIRDTIHRAMVRAHQHLAIEDMEQIRLVEKGRHVS